MGMAVLVVSSDMETRTHLARTLEARYDLISVANIRQAMELLSRTSSPNQASRPVKIVFCDRELCDGTYHDFLTAARALKNKTRVVITSRLADWDEYLNAMRLGAFDVIAAPCRAADVEWTLSQATRDLRESAEIGESESQQYRAATAE